MRRDEARPSLVQRLFAERHIYLRSGPESRYVVVSSALQAGVSAVFLLALIALGVALYSSVDSHLEAAEQSRQVARLEDVNKSLLAAAEAGRSADEPREAATPVTALAARLEEAEEASSRAEDMANAASAERDELQRELDLARSRIDEAVTQLAAVQAERDALMSQLNAQAEPAAGGSEGNGQHAALQAEVADLTAERATLEAELERVREQARESVAEVEAAEQDIAALRQQLGQAGQAQDDQVEQLQIRIATLQAENEQLTQAIDEVQSQSHELQTRVQEAETAGGTAADPAEVARLRDQLAEAEARLAEMEQARYEVEPGAGPDAGPSGSAVEQQLREELAAARQQIATLEQEMESSRAGLQRRPAIGDGVLASDVEQDEDGVPQVGPSPAYQTAAEAVTALRAELAAADELAGLVAESENATSAESIADLRTQIESAGQRIQNLNATLDRLRERDVALQRALVTLAPLPPPPAPR